MYKINNLEFTNLSDAMTHAKWLNEFVTITDLDSHLEIVGRFGVDSIVDGHCPDGVAYDWNKSSRIGAEKRKRV